MSKFITPFAAIALSCLMTSHAEAQTWPSRQVRIVVPLPAGGGPDAVARMFGSALSQKWGQPVVIENLPGGDGSTGAAAFVRTADDHALLYSIASVITVNPRVQKQMGFAPTDDLKPIAPVANAVLAVAVHTDVRARTLSELVALAKAAPDGMAWGSGPSLPRFAFMALLKKAQTSLRFVPYRDLATPQADLGEGRIQVLVTSLAAMRAPVEQGKAHILAITSASRAPMLASVSTAREAGHPEMEIDGLSGFFGGRGMGDGLRTNIAADIQNVGAEPSVRAKIEASGQFVVLGGPAEFAAGIERQHRQVSAIASLIDLSN